MSQGRLQRVFDAIDKANQEDPNRVMVNGREQPREHLYALRMSECQQAFAPQASELLQIACRAQHIQRWSIPRGDYPMDRAGYRRWRTELGRFHADTTAALMRDNDYTEEDCERVRSILQKKQLKQDTETQTMEDVACLVFLQHYLAGFAEKHDDDKLVDIIRKTWKKMSDSGHQAALQAKLPDSLATLVKRALS